MQSTRDAFQTTRVVEKFSQSGYTGTIQPSPRKNAWPRQEDLGTSTSASKEETHVGQGIVNRQRQRNNYRMANALCHARGVMEKVEGPASMLFMTQVSALLVWIPAILDFSALLAVHICI